VKHLSLAVIVAVNVILLAGRASAQEPRSAVAPAGSTVVTAWCSGGSGTCTANATCPGDKTIVNGYWWFIVPDGVGPAYGICGSNSGTCQSGQNNCTFTTSISGCGNPGWNRQMGFLYATCK
jgi:hypothetical protein